MKRRLYFVGVMIVCLLAISCNKDEYVHDNGSEQTVKKEKLYGIKTIDQPLTKAVAVNNKTWQSGYTIKIKFLNGSSQLQEAVKQVAATWLDYVGLKFEYVVTGTADVKIGFDLDTRYISWSTVGTDCQSIPQNEPSTNFVDLEYNWEEDYEVFQGDVLRAFGHILGLGFEHRNPESDIVFKANAQLYFEDYYGLSASEASELLNLYSTSQTNYSDYDPYSIMVLEIPNTIVTKRSMAVSANTELSDTDKEFIVNLYPKRYYEKITLTADYPCGEYVFSDYMCEVDNVIYGFALYYGAMSFDVTRNPNVQMFEMSRSYNPVVIDNLIYYTNVSNNQGFYKCLNTTDGTITTKPVSWTVIGLIKDINGRTYFGSDDIEGLCYFDIDGTVKVQSLYNENGTELVNPGIGQLVKDSAGTVYAVVIHNYNQYIYTIDSDTVELKFHRLWNEHISLYASISGKIYYAKQNLSNRYFGYIENGNMYSVANSAPSMGPYINKDEKIYFLDGSNLFSYENGLFNTIGRDEFSLSNMDFVDLIPLKHSSEIIIMARTIQPPSVFDMFILDPDGDNYAHRIQPPEDVEFRRVIETSDGKIYFWGYNSVTSEAAFWIYHID
jgi:hypothetical protein